MDPLSKTELIRPYSVVVVPDLDRMVSTNHAMMMHHDGYSRSVQVWSFSDMKLLTTLTLPNGPRGYEQLEPGEPRLLADGKTVLIHTFFCGLYQLDGVGTAQAAVHYLKTFEGTECGVPLRIGHYWIQTLSSEHELISLDISDLANIREVSHVIFDDKQWPHWISADADGRRLVVDSGGYGANMIFIVNFDAQTGSLVLDEHFRDPGSTHPGISMDGKTWPHGFHGDAFPHGAVFSRSSAPELLVSWVDSIGRSNTIW